jgi:hypothetical protein
MMPVSLSTVADPQLPIKWVWASEAVSKLQIIAPGLHVGPGFSPDAELI